MNTISRIRVFNNDGTVLGVFDVKSTSKELSQTFYRVELPAEQATTFFNLPRTRPVEFAFTAAQNKDLRGSPRKQPMWEPA